MATRVIEGRVTSRGFSPAPEKATAVEGRGLTRGSGPTPRWPLHQLLAEGLLGTAAPLQDGIRVGRYEGIFLGHWPCFKMAAAVARGLMGMSGIAPR